MRRLAIALLAASSLAGCAGNRSVETTPTFAPARFVPQVADKPQAARPVAGYRGPGLSGTRAVALANRSATVDPDSRSMSGATWVIDGHDPSLIYRVPLRPGRVTTVLLPEGEKFNGAVGGDVEAFLINVAYAGPRPAVSILPRSGRAKGNLQLVTTGGFYSFDLLVNGAAAVNLVDVGRSGGRLPAPAGFSTPQPEGDFTRLSLVPANGRRLPAWSPAEAWADSRKMVVRFNNPLPVQPALFAGQRGEQMVTYKSQEDGQSTYLVTSRRVTEAELRLGEESVRVTVDPDAIEAGSAAAERGAFGAKNADDRWRTAEAMPSPPPQTNLAVVVMPGGNGSVPAADPGTAPSPIEIGIAKPAPAARQPMANGVINGI